ncbi:MAG TPA: hypothetical protein VMZ28_07020 [Kofleriaceae bacterium]|nr:hypothetical protein [Kofleriaceae bacterium]
MTFRSTVLIAMSLVAACGGGDGSGGPGSQDGGDGDGGGGGAADAGAPDAVQPFVCPVFAAPATTGTVTSDGAVEISGLTASVAHPGVLWGHTDAAGAARLFAFATDGRALAVAAIDADVEDFEDVVRAGGPDPGREYLYLADVGDNDLQRDEVAVLRIEEPAVSLDDDGDEIDVTEVDAFTLTYDDGGPHDAEAIAIEPGTGDLYVITKRNMDDPATLVFRAAGVAGAAGGSLTLARVLSETESPALAGRVVTAGLSPDGALLMVGVKEQAFRIWPRSGTIAESLTGAPCVAPTVEDEQVEGAAFAADGDGYYIVPEGEDPPVYQVVTATRGP